MPNIGAPELIVILVVVLLLFGSTRLPKLARSLGEAKNEFERTSKGGGSEAASDRDSDRDSDGQTTTGRGRRQDDTVTVDRAELEELRRRARQAAPPPAEEDQKVTVSRAELEALRAQAAQAEKRV